MGFLAMTNITQIFSFVARKIGRGTLEAVLLLQHLVVDQRTTSELYLNCLQGKLLWLSRVVVTQTSPVTTLSQQAL